MKPWEETWEAIIWMHDVEQRPIWAVETNHNPPRAGEVELPICEFSPGDAERAKLAAAAPEMARMLLELEWHHAECLVCGETHKHAPDCRLSALLRKGGIVDD